MKKTLFVFILLVIVSVNAQLKARRISNYGKQISEYHQVELISVSQI
jgi:hypothetical protein